jgi:enterochelin esterase-like enzyme
VNRYVVRTVANDKIVDRMRFTSQILPIPLLALTVFGQQRADSLLSPEVHPDRRVTFRIRAPKASEAAFTGDWMKPNTSEKMTRDAEGVWSVTVGPLAPSIYIYTFSVDGVTMADPVNPRIKLRARTSASLVEVPGENLQIWDARDVPHGSVDVNWQKSKVLNGETRWIWVYTPPGYEKERSRRYPVLYLFHGSNDIAGGWVLAGQANFILDNLIAEKKAEPMIVVMPFGHAVPFGARGDNNKLYEEYVLQDVMPLVEGKYRTDAKRERRAIAGLSMGGGQALYMGFGHRNRRIQRRGTWRFRDSIYGNAERQVENGRAEDDLVCLRQG